MNWLKISAYYVVFALVIGIVAVLCEATIGISPILIRIGFTINLLAVPAVMYVQLNYTEETE